MENIRKLTGKQRQPNKPKGVKVVALRVYWKIHLTRRWGLWFFEEFFFLSANLMEKDMGRKKYSVSTLGLKNIVFAEKK